MRRTSVLSASALILGLGALTAVPAAAAETPRSSGSVVTTSSTDSFYAQSTVTQGDYTFSDVYSDSFSERTADRTVTGPNTYTNEFQSETRAETWNEITERDAESFYSTYYGDRVTERVAERIAEDPTGYTGSSLESTAGYSWDETTEGYEDGPEGQTVDFWENDWNDTFEESFWGTW